MTPEVGKKGAGWCFFAAEGVKEGPIGGKRKKNPLD